MGFRANAFGRSALHVYPVRPGMAEGARALVAELMGPRRGEWAESKRRRGIGRVAMSLVHEDGRDLFVTAVQGSAPVAGVAALAGSEDPFDVWLRGRMTELFEEPLAVEHLADTAPRPGPWRGMRRFSR